MASLQADRGQILTRICRNGPRIGAPGSHKAAHPSYDESGTIGMFYQVIDP
jgi:hypothetical protein